MGPRAAPRSVSLHVHGSRLTSWLTSAGLLDAMLEPTDEEDEPRDLCSTFG